VFHVDSVLNVPCQVICEPGARANAGACENDPAYGSAMSPLWARNFENPDPQRELREHQTFTSIELFASAYEAAAKAAAKARAAGLECSPHGYRAGAAHQKAGLSGHAATLFLDVACLAKKAKLPLAAEAYMAESKDLTSDWLAYAGIGAGVK
jgi:hypothetical protein